MPRYEMLTMKDKETKNYDRYHFGLSVNGEEDITGSVYLPRNARHVKVIIEYTL